MITYEQVKMALTNPPTESLIDLYNEIETQIHGHEDCVKGKYPFNKLQTKNAFCISATSIQSQYVAFVLGKHVNSSFPPEVMQLFFNVHTDFRLQIGKIKGDNIDGCICLLHQEEKVYNLQEIYESIYC